MAIPALAIRAGTALVSAAPEIKAKAMELLDAATQGKVATPAAIQSFVGSSPDRAKLVTESMIRGGINLSDIISSDLAGKNKDLQMVRASALNVIARLRANYDAKADTTLSQRGTFTDAASALLAIRRVNLAFRMYGSQENYYLMNPTGGIPMEEFTMVLQMGREFNRATNLPRS